MHVYMYIKLYMHVHKINLSFWVDIAISVATGSGQSAHPFQMDHFLWVMWVARSSSKYPDSYKTI